MIRRDQQYSPGNEALDRQSARRRRRERAGRRAEWIAVVILMLKGYRVLARRYRVATGEIDIIAARGRRLAFIEVKRRRTIDEARLSISNRQAERMSRAADHWLARHPKFQGYRIGLDAFLIAPGAWPRHLLDACQKGP